MRAGRRLGSPGSSLTTRSDKLKAGAAEAAGGADVRAAVAAIEREKLERYQRRYEEYVRIGKALAALGGER